MHTYSRTKMYSCIRVMHTSVCVTCSTTLFRTTRDQQKAQASLLQADSGVYRRSREEKDQVVVFRHDQNQSRPQSVPRVRKTRERKPPSQYLGIIYLIVRGGNMKYT